MTTLDKNLFVKEGEETARTNLTEIPKQIFIFTVPHTSKIILFLAKLQEYKRKHFPVFGTKKY